MNIKENKFKPYKQPEDIIKYINVKSNHPPNVTRQILKTIEERLSVISLNEETFNKKK